MGGEEDGQRFSVPDHDSELFRPILSPHSISSFTLHNDSLADTDRHRERESQMEMPYGHRPARASFSDDCPEFFKIFLSSASSQQLSIPPDFVKHFNGTIPEKVDLIDHATECWCVRLEETDGRVWFTNGWQCFASDHYLSCGDFLIFKYNRGLSFEVKIFSVRGCRKEETVAIGKTTQEVKLEQDSKAEQTCSKQKHSDVGLKKNEADSSKAHRHKSQKTGKANLEENRTPEVVSRLVASKTPHFVLRISHCTLVTAYIHKSVVQAFKIELKPKVVIRDQNGKSWPVKIIFKTDGRIAIGTGWSNFARSSVKARDQCVFEFVLQSGNTCKEIRVYVLRGSARMKKPSRHWHWHRHVNG